MTVKPFGTLSDGRKVEVISLRGGSLHANVLTYGAILQDLRLSALSDRPLTLGSTEISAYADGPMASFGCIVGPVANRIGRARGNLDGRPIVLEDNAPGGHCLHSGAAGLQRKLWHVTEVSLNRVTLAVAVPDGDGGLPGNRTFTATYALEAERTLSLTLTANTDRPTWVNCAFHGYWHLGGPAGIDGHSLALNANEYLPTDESVLPTGERAPVQGTDFDFLTARRLTPSDQLDTNYLRTENGALLSPEAWLQAPDGLFLRVTTTALGMQVFTADPIDSGTYLGHDGVPYQARCGLALEPQHWPDAPNNPDFPSIRLQPDDTWRQVSQFKFSTP